MAPPSKCLYCCWDNTFGTTMRPAGRASAVERIRAGILAELRAGAASSPRPVRFVTRRTAWHALDHAWEIQDKQEL
jgi:hypothetical protein